MVPTQFNLQIIHYCGGNRRDREKFDTTFCRRTRKWREWKLYWSRYEPLQLLFILEICIFHIFIIRLLEQFVVSPRAAANCFLPYTRITTITCYAVLEYLTLNYALYAHCYYFGDTILMTFTYVWVRCSGWSNGTDIDCHIDDDLLEATPSNPKPSWGELHDIPYKSRLVHLTIIFSALAGVAITAFISVLCYYWRRDLRSYPPHHSWSQMLSEKRSKRFIIESSFYIGVASEEPVLFSPDIH